MAEKSDIQQLIQQLYDFKTRATARQRLGQKGEVAAEPLMELLNNESAPDNARWSAITLLASLRYEPAIPELLKNMQQNLALKGEAARALTTITGKDLGEDVTAWERELSGDTGTHEEQAEAEPSHERAALFQEAVGDVAEELSWEDAGYLYLRIPLPEGRKHQIVVTFDEKDADGRPLTTFYTECGPATPEAAETVSRRNLTLRFGKLMLEAEEDDTQKVVMREMRPTSILSPELTREIILSMASEADNIEFELTRSDHI